MFRFISTLDRPTLCNRYVARYNTSRINGSLKAVFSDFPELKRILPRGFKTADKILIADFPKLAEIYFAYLDFTSRLPKANRNNLNERLSSVFNYDMYRQSIANFLNDPANHFEIDNCVYCDIEKIKGYFDRSTGRHIRGFQTDHILDKGKCPIVALSLFNFAPSCSLCNSRSHKGSKSLGNDKDEALRLSPTSRENRFAEEVYFALEVANSNLQDLKMFESCDDIEIDLIGRTDKYEKTLSIFHLKDRYNARKSDLVDPIYKMRKYPKEKIYEIAGLSGYSAEDFFEDIVGFKKRAREKTPMEKCRRDIFTRIYGSVEWEELSQRI